MLRFLCLVSFFYVPVGLTRFSLLAVHDDEGNPCILEGRVQHLQPRIFLPLHAKAHLDRVEVGHRLAQIQQELQPDELTVQENIAIVAAVGHQMAFRPGVSGQIFAALGKAGINIRMINQGPDELNIIFGVQNKDFEEAIRVLYNSFVK